MYNQYPFNGYSASAPTSYSSNTVYNPYSNYHYVQPVPVQQSNQFQVNDGVRVQNEQTIQNLLSAINGEYSAIICYQQLSELAPDSDTKKIILEIRDDEIKHYEVFSAIYKELTGQKPKVEQTEPCEDKYKLGLISAFKDEQQTVDRYLKNADHADHLPHLKEAYLRAALDEQNHAVWFLFLLYNLKSH